MTKKEQLESQGFKTYENDSLRVFWNPSLCTHAGECVRGSRAVFDPARRPWIDLSQADADAVAAIIDRCPSRALQYEKKDSVRIVFEEHNRQALAYDGTVVVGECQYVVSGSAEWTVSHTGVRPEYNGRGIARRLVEAVVGAARERKIRIVPLCSYARRMMSGTEEYRDVLA